MRQYYTDQMVMLRLEELLDCCNCLDVKQVDLDDIRLLLFDPAHFRPVDAALRGRERDCRAFGARWLKDLREHAEKAPEPRGAGCNGVSGVQQSS